MARRGKAYQPVYLKPPRVSEYERVKDRARKGLLEAIKRSAPHVLTSLEEKVYPVFKSAYDLNVFEEEDEGDVAWLFVECRLPETAVAHSLHKNDLVELKRALLRWCERHKLLFDDLWFVSCALVTLRTWCDYGVDGDWDFACVDERAVGLDDESMFGFVFPDWDPGDDTWRSYEKKLNEKFKSEKDRYRRLREKRLMSKGGSPAQETNSPAHFDWLVEFQINGKPFSDASAGPHLNGVVDTTFVREKIMSLAALLNLRLRPAPRGRPRKSK
jgi:hypothetical protein